MAPKCTVYLSLSTSHELLETRDLFTNCIVLSFPEHHVVRIIQNIAFSDSFLSLSNIHLRSRLSFHGLTAFFQLLFIIIFLLQLEEKKFFFFQITIYFIINMRISHSFLIHSPVGRHHVCLQEYLQELNIG